MEHHKSKYLRKLVCLGWLIEMSPFRTGSTIIRTMQIS
jgi:hypothetical protein